MLLTKLLTVPLLNETSRKEFRVFIAIEKENIFLFGFQRVQYSEFGIDRKTRRRKVEYFSIIENETNQNRRECSESNPIGQPQSTDDQMQTGRVKFANSLFPFSLKDFISFQTEKTFRKYSTFSFTLRIHVSGCDESFDQRKFMGKFTDFSRSQFSEEVAFFSTESL